MDKSKNKRSSLKNSSNSVLGYSIQFGETTFEKSLEERIQAARVANSINKQAQKQNRVKLPSTCSKNVIEKDSLKNVSSINSKKIIHNSHELKKKCRLNSSTIRKADNEQTYHIPKITSTSLSTKSYPSSSFKSKFNEGGAMQRRLEAIKAKNLCNQFCVYDTSLESTNSSYNLLKNSAQCALPIKSFPKHVNSSAQLSKSNTYVSMHNEHTAQSSFHKNPSQVDNTFVGHCDRSQENTYTNSYTVATVTSAQSRLTKARNDILTKSKEKCTKTNQSLNQSDISKVDEVKQPSTCASVSLNKNQNTSVHNIQNKAKRLHQTNQRLRKKTPLKTTTKKMISKNSDMFCMVDKQLVTMHQKPVCPYKMVSPKLSNTTIPKILENNAVKEKTNEEELKLFSFVTPKTSAVQQRLENIRKGLPPVPKISSPNNLNHNIYSPSSQLNNYDSDDNMEWEDAIDSSNVVDQLNDLRRNVLEYESMEWTPDSIMYSDAIKHCLVIDTNVFLTDLKSITIVIDQFLPEYGYMTIVVPWQVVQELDCMKKGETALNYRAREAIRWLLKGFSDTHPRLKGQPMTKKDGMSADDAILKCAIYVKERVQHVHLITNDNNLSIKSKINNIPVENSTWLKNLVSNKNTPKSVIFQDAVKNYPFIENALITKFESRLRHVIDEVLKLAVDRNPDCTALTEEAWLLTPQINLTQCLLKLKEHWDMIAPERLSKTPEKPIYWLMCFFKDFSPTSLEITLNWNSFYCLLKNCSELLNALPFPYHSVTEELCKDSMTARIMLKQQLNTKLNDELSVSLSSLQISNNANDVESILLNILNGVDKYCHSVYKAYGFERDPSITQLNTPCPNVVYLNGFIDDFFDKVSNITKVMSKINILSTEKLLDCPLIVNEFLKAIIKFDNNCEKLNKENLTNYCVMKDRNLFSNILISLGNDLAAMQNLINTLRL